MTQQRLSQYDPFIQKVKGGFDIDSEGNVYLKLKKLCLNSDCTMYIVGTSDNTADFYIGSTKTAEINAAGIRKV